MTDVHSKTIRSKNMRAIRSKNTGPELLVRHALHAMGFRYSLHRKDLPGKPDLVLSKYRSVILVHGCFWHGHNGCQYFKIPATRTKFWLQKFELNQLRDDETIKLLLDAGWRVAIVWECALKPKDNEYFTKLIKRLSVWIRSAPRSSRIEFPIRRN